MDLHDIVDEANPLNPSARQVGGYLDTSAEAQANNRRARHRQAGYFFDIGTAVEAHCTRSAWLS